jgi:hypothetical protein
MSYDAWKLATPPDDDRDATPEPSRSACTCGENWQCELCWSEAIDGVEFDGVALGGDTSEAGRTAKLSVVSLADELSGLEMALAFAEDLEETSTRSQAACADQAPHQGAKGGTMILGKPIKTHGLVVGAEKFAPHDALFEFRGRRVLLGERSTGWVVAWSDDKGVPLRWSHADKRTALRTALYVAEFGELPLSQMRKTRTLRNLVPIH